MIPRRIQIFLRRILIKQKVKKYKNIWSIDENAKEKLSDESISLNKIIELSNKLPLINNFGDD